MMAMKATTVAPPARGMRAYWLSRAAELRGRAEKLTDAESRDLLLRTARHYELLASNSDREPPQTHVAIPAKEAAERAALGERHIVQQRRLIETLKRDGHDTRDAEALLRTFEEMQHLHVEHRDRLQREAGLPPDRTGRHNPR